MITTFVGSGTRDFSRTRALDVIVSIAEESRWLEMEADIEKLFANPTLGAAANGVFLDVMEAQLNENRAAEVEGRAARIVKRDQRFPGWEQGKDIPSNYSDVSFGGEFDDGSPVCVPQGGPEVPSSGCIDAAQRALTPPSGPVRTAPRTTRSATK